MPDTSFDVIVIGTGVAGQTAAEELGAAGLKVAAVDRREFGGTCELRGCEPKKTLYAAAEAAERIPAHADKGVVGEARISWPDLIAFKRTFTDPASAMIEHAITSSPATALHGEARFVSADVLDVGGTEYSAKHFVVAAGARPMPLGIDGEELVTDSEHFMTTTELPERVVLIGGGYISFEFAHMAAAAGSKVTILHRSDRVLKGFDADLSAMLAEAYRADGIAVRTNAPVTAVREGGSGGELEVICADGEAIPCGMVVHGAGRVPDLDALELEVGDVRFGPRGIEVDEYLRSTTNPRVWSAGDAVASGPELTPVAVRQARVIVKNILASGPCHTYAPKVVPSVVFANPPLATAGLTSDEAERRAIDVDVRFHDTTQWESSRRVGCRASGAKILLEPGTGRVLGAALLGPHAEEVINLFAAAILCDMTAEQLRAAHWAYPTNSSEIVYLVG